MTSITSGRSPLSDPITVLQDFTEMDGKIHDCQQAGTWHFFYDGQSEDIF
jgi:hypothetical protein